MKQHLRYAFLFICLLFCNTIQAQFSQVSHTAGTQLISGSLVSVSHIGPGTGAGITSVPGCGVINYYSIGNPSSDGYKFIFNGAATRLRILFYALQRGDTARIDINGSKYNLTSANLSYPTLACSTYAATAISGDLTYTSGSSCGPIGYSGQVDIFPTKPIDSVNVYVPSIPNNQCGHIAFGFYFALDTLAYIKQPYTDTLFCAGDTLRLKYYTTNTFNTGNTLSVQLSNSTGSFAIPTTIGSKAATYSTNDSITCVLPKTLAGGTGYRVRIVSSSPVMTSFDNQVNIRIKPLAANRIVGSNSPICEPDTVRLNSSTSSAGTTFSWAGPNSFSSTLQNPKTGNTSSTVNSGNYIVTMTLNGCISKDTTAVTVKPLPAKPTAGSNTPLCTGATINLTGTTTTSGVTYSWVGPNGFTASTQNPSKFSASTTDAGNFIVTVTLNGCIAKDTEAVVVYPPTSTPSASNTGPYCIGSDVKLSAGTMAGATYTWSGPNGFTSNMQNPTITAAGLNAAGTYSVYATVNGCNSNTATTTVSIVSGPTVVAYASPNDTICLGTTTTFTALPANPGTGASYQWLKNGIALPGSNSLSFPVSGLIDGDVVSFLLTPGTGAACTTPVNSNFITMTVRQYQQPILEMQASDTTIWPGLLVNFNVTNTSGGANPTYQWKVNNQNIVGATSTVWGTTQLQDNDKVCVVMSPDFLCANPGTASACVTMHVSTGINQLNNTQLKVYPNPAKETLTIEGLTANTSIQLIDVLGRVVYTTTGAGIVTIPTKQLANGNYVLKLTATDGKNTVVSVGKE
jgi:hypothetical protein